MAHIWTDNMGPIAANPAHEKMAREAVIASCDFWEGLADGALTPRFSGSLFVQPQNEAAEALVKAVTSKVNATMPGAVMTGVEIQTIISTAVHCGEVFANNDFGESGWLAVGVELARTRAASATGRRRR